jgi:hypothetical protein
MIKGKKIIQYAVPLFLALSPKISAQPMYPPQERGSATQKTVSSDSLLVSRLDFLAKNILKIPYKNNLHLKHQETIGELGMSTTIFNIAYEGFSGIIITSTLGKPPRRKLGDIEVLFPVAKENEKNIFLKYNPNRKENQLVITKTHIDTTNSLSNYHNPEYDLPLYNSITQKDKLLEIRKNLEIILSDFLKE